MIIKHLTRFDLLMAPWMFVRAHTTLITLNSRDVRVLRVITRVCILMKKIVCNYTTIYDHPQINYYGQTCIPKWLLEQKCYFRDRLFFEYCWFAKSAKIRICHDLFCHMEHKMYVYFLCLLIALYKLLAAFGRRVAYYNLVLLQFKPAQIIRFRSTI